jgi:hypothetical protein
MEPGALDDLFEMEKIYRINLLDDGYMETCMTNFESATRDDLT